MSGTFWGEFSSATIESNHTEKESSNVPILTAPCDAMKELSLEETVRICSTVVSGHKKVLQTANSIVCCFPALANVCAFSACFKLACCFKFLSYYFFLIFLNFSVILIFKECIGKLGGSPRHCADLSCPSLPSYSGLQWEIPWPQTATALGNTLMISLSIQMFTPLLRIKARVALFFLRLPELNETQTHITWMPYNLCSLPTLSCFCHQ